MDELWQWRDVMVHGVRAPRLDGVSLCIHEGITAVLGWSGAGKSTLLNILVGFEKPDAGEVQGLHADKDGESLPFFWVPQEEGLWPHMRAAEQLETVASPGQDTAPLLAMFGLTELSDRFPGKLSVGERSRLSVARALASRASVLVMDEPLSHVNRTWTDAGWEALIAHVRQTGTSLVYATHSPRTVLGYADRVIFLSEGRVCYAGDVDDLYQHPATRELAECLGPANWFTPEEAQLWLGMTPETPVCLRPAETVAVSAADGALTVSHVHFAGDSITVELAHESGASRRVLLLPGDYQPRIGDRVRLTTKGQA